MSMVARTITASFSSVSMSETKERSIFSSETGMDLR